MLPRKYLFGIDVFPIPVTASGEYPFHNLFQRLLKVPRCTDWVHHPFPTPLHVVNHSAIGFVADWAPPNPALNRSQP
jgi:hypothetical protein